MTGDFAGGVLRLNAVNEEVWRRTGKAVSDSMRRKPSLEVWCGRCGRHLGAAGSGTYGPLFTSSWLVELPLASATYVNGRRLSRRETLIYQDTVFPARERSGAPIPNEKIEGTIALLALPPELHQEYPDLMVRCKHHGDAVLAREDVLRDLCERRPVHKVNPRRPHLVYVCPPHAEPLLSARTVRYPETRGYCSVDDRKAFGARLRGIRNQQGLSLQGVEEKSAGRWKAVVIGSYERGDRGVTGQDLAELARFYNIPIAELLPNSSSDR